MSRWSEALGERDFRGNYIDGAFVPGEGTPFESVNPATEGEVVCRAFGDSRAADAAVVAARRALKSWRRTPLDGRVEALRAVAAKVPEHAERIALAITAEMGKPIGESRAEASSLSAKIEGVIAQLPHELPPAAPGAPGEQRFHALGVVGVIGPFNFPVHLCHTHVVPALLTGNTVVVKPSERTPLSGQRYAELFDAAGFPAGVFNLVHGLGDTGARLATGLNLDGLVFTGSYATGRRIREATLDAPHTKICLELGGKNPAVVLDDADLDQAVREILLGALLSSGQRCTATSRVIATPGIAAALEGRLIDALARVRPGDPLDPRTLMGPLSSVAARDKFLDDLATGRAQGAKVLVESEAVGPGAGVTPSLYRLRGDESFRTLELFGPHLDLEYAEDESDAFARAADTPYGLSASLFSRDAEALERFYDVVHAGVINFNRSTNGASGLLPFGGTGMSGNWHAAGAHGPRLCTFPVAVMSAPFGTHTPNEALDAALTDGGPADESPDA